MSNADLSFFDGGKTVEKLQSACRVAATQLDSLCARVKELEAEQVALVRDYQQVNGQLADEMKRTRRAEQDRDEAYRHLRSIVPIAARCEASPEIDAARDLVRRLASGPEKIAAASDGEERK